MRLITLFVTLLALPVMALQNATPTIFVPTPMNSQFPTRFYMGLDNANVFSGGESAYPGTFISKGQVGLMNLQLELALIRQITEGFDIGVGIHGGVQSPYSMFFGDNKTGSAPFPAGASRYGMIIGADLMMRYMQFLSESFFAGIQAQVGYNYTDTAPGIPDGAVNSFSNQSWYAPYTSRAAANSFIPVNAGIVLGWQFNKSVDLYFFPAVELGQTGNQTNSSDPSLTNNPPSSPDTGVWKSAVGMNVATGVTFNVGYCKVVVQLKPRIANFNNSNSWGLDMYTGASMDF